MGACLAASICGLWHSPAAAQTDVQLWTVAGVRYRPSRPVRLDLDLHLRVDDNVSRLGKLMPELGASYDPARWLRLGLGYRFMYARDNNGNLEVAHRLHVQGRARGDVGPVELSYRLRFQERIKNNLRHVIRNRLGLSVDTDTDVTPGMSMELFTRLGDGQALMFDKWRLTIGATWSANSNVFDLFYRAEIAIDDPNDPTLHIIGLGYQRRVRGYSN